MRVHAMTTCLFLGLAFTVTPLIALAQGGPGGPANNLAVRLANLEARVATLEAQPPGGGRGLLVVDASDQVVGVPAGNVDDTIMFIAGRWVEVSVDTDGFAPQGGGRRQVQFTSSDCTGTPLIASADILRTGFTFDGQILLFAGGPVSVVTSNSRGELNPDGSITNCFANTSTGRAGPLAQFDLSTLGFVTPFRIIQ
jgi:hypothetical protein